MSVHQISSTDRPNSLFDDDLNDNDLKQFSTSFRPRLTCKISFFADRVVFTQGDRHSTLKVDSQSLPALEKVFLMMDGSKSLAELQQQLFSHNPEIISTIVQNLARQELIEDASISSINSGIDTILELEESADRLWSKYDGQQWLWQQITSGNREVAAKVLYGLAIEYYYFLIQQSSFDAVILGFSQSSQIRNLVSQMYVREYAGVEILGQALQAIGISETDLTQTMPLPQTTAVCHALNYWANFDRLFFLTTLDLVRKQTRNDLRFCLQTGRQLNLNADFLDAIARVNSNLDEGVEHLTRRIFQTIPNVKTAENQRCWGQTHLLVEMYDAFYRAVWSGYATAPNLLRKIELV